MLYLGVDLGGTNIKVGLVNNDGKLLYKSSFPVMNANDPYDITKSIVNLCIDILNSYNTNLNDIAWIGIGVPGPCDSDNGKILSTTNLGFENFDISTEISKYIDKPIFLCNDADCAALGEATGGATKNSSNSIVITLGTGIGAGIIIEGKIYNGFNHVGGEFGHTVVAVDGLPCRCGRNGCLETYASASALIRMTRECAMNNKESLIWKLCGNNIDDITGKTIFDAAKLGDIFSIATLKIFIKYLAIGIVNIINIFQPEILAIGGGLSNEEEYLIEPLKKFVNNNQFCPLVKQTTIVKTSLGNNAGIIGAAMLGFK